MLTEYILCTTKEIKMHKKAMQLLKIGKWGVSQSRLRSWHRVCAAVIHHGPDLCFA